MMGSRHDVEQWVEEGTDERKACPPVHVHVPLRYLGRLAPDEQVASWTDEHGCVDNPWK